MRVDDTVAARTMIADAKFLGEIEVRLVYSHLSSDAPQSEIDWPPSHRRSNRCSRRADDDRLREVPGRDRGEHLPVNVVAAAEVVAAAAAAAAAV